MRRVGQIIGLKPDQIEAYERLHAAVWPEVLAMISTCNMRNYSIFSPRELLFAYFEYVGDDYEAETMASVAATIGIDRRLPYSASKGAVLATDAPNCIDFVTQGIRCNAICPGTVHNAVCGKLPARNFAGHEGGAPATSRSPTYRTYGATG